ncbi:MAG: hypothetical protein V1921_04825 [Candidatus Altiarchaeota archaeon]
MAETAGKGGEKYKVKICPRCDEKNSPSVDVCQKCGTTLDIKTLLEEDERRNTTMGVLSTILSDDRVKEAIAASIKSQEEHARKTQQETISDQLIKLLNPGAYDLQLTTQPTKTKK